MGWIKSYIHLSPCKGMGGVSHGISIYVSKIRPDLVGQMNLTSSFRSFLFNIRVCNVRPCVARNIPCLAEQYGFVVRISARDMQLLCKKACLRMSLMQK